MSLLEKASLIVTPNAYKESVLYSVVPNTTLGDMDVVRATTATRVNGQGLIEVVPKNLFLRSEQFENASWLAGGSGAFVITTNSTTAPNGTLTADKFIAPLTNQTIRQNLATINTSYTLSVYLKTNSGTKQMRLFINDTEIQSVINVTANWQRFTLSGTTGGVLLGSGRAGFSNIDILNESSFVYAWGAQLEVSSTATTYFPTTDRLNIPRIDYTNGTCPSLLVEPQRTNLFSYSEQFDDVSWTKTNATVTANSTNAPTGNLTADTITNNSGTTGSILKQITVSNNSDTYNSSFFVKKQSGFLVFQFRYLNGVTPVGCAIHFNKLTGEFLNINSSFGFTGIPINIKAESYGDYFRFSYSLANNSTGNTVLRIEIQPHRGNSLGNLSQTNGNAVMWGAQLEQGSYPTSYIPTVASTVTRNADVISKTGISSLIGQTEGTVFLDADVTNTTGLQIGNTDGGGDYNNSIQISFGTIATNVNVFNGGIPQFSNASAVLTGRKKIAIAYKANDFALYINGTQIATDTSGTVPTLSGIFFNHQNLGTTNGKINTTAIWKTRLTNSELAQLTTI